VKLDAMLKSGRQIVDEVPRLHLDLDSCASTAARQLLVELSSLKTIPGTGRPELASGPCHQQRGCPSHADHPKSLVTAVERKKKVRPVTAGGSRGCTVRGGKAVGDMGWHRALCPLSHTALAGLVCR
jgi:hypothetical protein